MTHSENPEENYLERLFWEFDSVRKVNGAERDAFKKACRCFANYRVDNALREAHGFEKASEPAPMKPL